MTDIKALDEFGTWLDGELDPAPCPSTRARVLAATAPQPWYSAPHRRAVLASGLATVMVGAVATAALLVGGSAADPQRQPPGGVPAASAPGVGPATTRAADPAKVLAAAVAAMSQQSDPAPRPDQFLYIRTTTKGPYEDRFYEVWRPVDGVAEGMANIRTVIRPVPAGLTPKYLPLAPSSASGPVEFRRDHEVIPGCRDGEVTVTPTPGAAGRTPACVPNPAYRTDLPTDVDGLLAYVDDQIVNLNLTGKDRDAVRWFTLANLFMNGYLPPNTAVAVFEAAARIPGMRATEGVTGGSGRPAVALWCEMTNVIPGNQQALFDADTFEYLGSAHEEVGLDGKPAGVTHTVVEKRAFVDKIGQVP